MTQTAGTQWTEISSPESADPVTRIHNALTHRENSDRLADAMGAQIWVTDLHGRYIRVNEAWLAAHGHDSVKTVLGKTAHDLFTPVLAAAIISDDLRVTDTGEDVTSVFTDEVGRSFKSFRMPLIDSQEIVGLVGVITPQDVDQSTNTTVVSHDEADKLTGASNLKALHEHLAEILTSPDPQSVLLLDLDDFHVVNNSLGREVGDRLLQKAAKRLITVFGSRLFRTGGNDFVIILPTTDKAQLDVVTEQILQRWRQPLLVDGTEIYGGVSIGVAPIGGQTTSEEVLQDAELALRKAKGTGRNRAVIFDPKQKQLADDELWRQMLVRRAVANREFSVHWQPIFDLETAEIAGVEALLRWQPAGGQTARPAAEFIPFLEHSGLVIPVGLQVIDDACRQHTSWRSQDKISKPIPLFVNVSRRQFTSDTFANDVLNTLQRHGVDPQHLTIEVADFAPGESYEKVVADLTKLSTAGVRVAIDDFGAGWSALSDLAELPIHATKIARSMVDRIEEGQNDPLLDSIQHITKSLGLMSIVQGVENDMQLNWLRSKGWTHVQGYHLSKPLDSEAMTSFLVDVFGRTETQRWGTR